MEGCAQHVTKKHWRKGGPHLSKSRFCAKLSRSSTSASSTSSASAADSAHAGLSGLCTRTRHHSQGRAPSAACLHAPSPSSCRPHPRHPHAAQCPPCSRPCCCHHLACRILLQFPVAHHATCMPCPTCLICLMVALSLAAYCLNRFIFISRITYLSQ